LEAIRPDTTTAAEVTTAPSPARATSRPADWGAAEAVAARLDTFAPETAAAAGVIRSRLVPALHALAEADHAGDEAAATRAAAEARQAIDAARRELARLQDALTDRDPLTAAKWLTRSAADLLGRAPPDGADVPTAAGYQREAEAALARAWDLSVHRAASERLAGLPWVRPLLAGAPVGPPLGPPADLLAADPSPVAVAANDTETVGGGAEAADDAAPRDAIPAEYEPSLELYFKAIERTRGGSR
jgi:hypothetical protein